MLRVAEHASAKLPSTTVVVSRTQQHYRSRHRIEPVYVPNGTRLRKKRPASQLAKWGLEPGGYILFMGRFSSEKNCHLLIEAYEKIETPVKLVLAGGSSHSDAYASELLNHRRDKIRLLDWFQGTRWKSC